MELLKFGWVMLPCLFTFPVFLHWDLCIQVVTWKF
jgi:hypothetical protein